ncbi:TPA: hypothetical protein HA278_05695, partial [Candidatus Woesearchaeota archaeon]|nr:hypothetical protein [Candidatus Woesearchaeota archaeon]
MKRFIIISLIIISLFALAGATEEKSFSKSYMSEQSLSTKSTYSFVKSEPKSIKSDKKSITTKKSYKKVQKPTKTTSVKRIRKALMKAAKNKEPISLTPKKETKPIMFNAKKGEKASLKSSPIPKPDFTCNVDEDHIHLSNTPRPLPRYVCFQNSRLHERVCAEEWQGYEFEFVERCRFGCHNGACVEAECRDSDANFIFENGNNIFEQGTIEGVTDDEDLEQIIENHDNIEYCVNESTIAEMFCENDVITMEEFACSEGTVCRNGACTIECTDSDNSTDQLWGPDSRIQGSTRGVLRGEFVTVEDECTEDGLLVEYTCLNDGMSIGVAANSCDIGLECNNGACIPEPEECTNDFANYPCFFENNSEFNGFAVIGRNATLSERYAASIIFTGMEEYYHIEVPPQSIRYDYNFSVETSPNMISIGSGCVNR